MLTTKSHSAVTLLPDLRNNVRYFAQCVSTKQVFIIEMLIEYCRCSLKGRNCTLTQCCSSLLTSLCERGIKTLGDIL